MRWHIVEIFGNLISQVSESLDSIALVGGHIFEPELEVLKYKDLTHYGVEFDSRVKTELFDLNISQIVDKNYDLVLCSQVLEHVYDVKQAIENLAKLVREGGFLWIACPASNYAHGSPEYFSAGYTPELITNLLPLEDFEVIFAEKYGSERMYFYTHTLQRWPTQREYKFPLRFKFSRYFFRDFFWRIIALFKSPKFDSELHHATETVVFARKKFTSLEAH
jgi:SAM-dependent methyltransferase